MVSASNLAKAILADRHARREPTTQSMPPCFAHGRSFTCPKGDDNGRFCTSVCISVYDTGFSKNRPSMCSRINGRPRFFTAQPIRPRKANPKGRKPRTHPPPSKMHYLRRKYPRLGQRPEGFREAQKVPEELGVTPGDNSLKKCPFYRGL